MKLQDRIIAVTGGGNGLGRALVLNLLSRGASVAAVDINESALKETVKRSGDKKNKITTHVVNVSDKDSIEALPNQVISQHGGVDGLINNAGIIQPFVRLTDLDYEAIERVMNINFFGTLYMTKAFLPHLLTRPEAHITNISSMGGFLPVPGQTIYGASKAAVKLLTEGLNSELLSTNVRVTVVFPGALRTNIAANSGVGIGQNAESAEGASRTLAPNKAAQIILDGIEQDRYRILVGSDAAFMDLVTRLSPRRAARFIYRQMKSLLPE
jgi:NAD(P)-dependent dehydrogenase (short-subunit alcohol dehydrogenase family)